MRRSTLSTYVNSFWDLSGLDRMKQVDRNSHSDNNTSMKTYLLNTRFKTEKNRGARNHHSERAKI